MYFVGFGSLVVSRFWHGIRSPYEVVCDRAGFFGIGEKIGGKQTKNWPRKWSLEFVKKLVR